MFWDRITFILDFGVWFGGLSNSDVFCSLVLAKDVSFLHAFLLI